MDKDKNLDRITRGVLGDIDPTPAAREHESGSAGDVDKTGEGDEAMTGGSQQGESHHSGSRDVTEG